MLKDVWRGLREPRLYVLMGLALVLWVGAYQYKREYVVEVADRVYQPYIEGFNDVEKSAGEQPILYRWSMGDSVILFPGIGNEPVQVDITTIGSRPNAEPPKVAWSARGQSFDLQTQAGERTDTFFVDRGSNQWEGDLRFEFHVSTFTDPRELGVIIRRVVVRPADYGLRPFVIPSVGTLVGLLVGLVGAYLLFLVAGVKRSFGLMVGGLVGVLGVAGILFVRPDTALLAEELPSLFGWGLLFGALGRVVLCRPYGASGWEVGDPQGVSPGLNYVAPTGLGGSAGGGVSREVKRSIDSVGFAGSAVVGWGVVAFVVAFMVRFGGLIYPQFLTSDIILHVHNAQDVLRGNWVFTEPLPDGRLVPYPPAYYLLVALISPFTGVGDDGLSLALKWSSSLVDALTCLMLVWVSGRVWGRRGLVVGAFGAWAYAASPGVFDLFSAGNYTNLFGQSVQNLTLLGAIAFLAGSGRKWVGAGLLGVGFFLTMMGHYGMLIATLGVMGIFLVWTIVVSVRKVDSVERAWTVLGSNGAALLVGVGAYYWRFLDVMWGQVADVFGQLLGSGGSDSGSLVDAPGVEKAGFLEGLGKLPGKVVQLLGAALVISGVVGLGLMPRRLWAVRALIGSWLGAMVVFALLDRVVGDSVRWYYLGAAPLALLAGRFWAGLGMRRGWAAKLAILVVAAALVWMIGWWVELIYVRYH
ncbi:MAG: hypothetical protein ABIQ44_10750 [Chloroflexia bacterium]